MLRDAGSAIGAAEADGAQAEFLPVLAALVPTLVSTVGPMVARAVTSRLSPRARQVVRRVAAAAPAAPAGRPASPAAGGMSNVLAIIARLLQNAPQAGGREGAFEAGAEAEPLIAEAVAALEAIVDVDDRVRITTTTAVPWRRICALRIQFPSGATYRGTGFLIGPRALATAGHCVYLHNQGGWARRVEVFPGANGPSFPLGRAESRTFRSVAGWVTHRRPESDYGCIVLPAGSFSGRNLGSFGFAAFDAPTLLAQRAVVAGYPGDKPFAELWGAARRLKTVTEKTLVYNTATMGGQSGAPVYIKRGGQRYVVGIHNYGSSTGNSATRVTPSVFARLAAWARL
jgi:V8-like Glu-specific endopeptidase